MAERAADGAAGRTADPTIALHVGQLLQRVPGGIGRYVRELARALDGHGVGVLPFAAGPRPPDLPGDHHVDLGRPGGTLRYELWHRLRRRPVPVGGDVVHAPSLAVPPTGDVPLVVTVHDVAFLRLPQYFTVRGIRFHERGLRLARDEAAAVVVPSDFVAGELVEEGFDRQRVHVAPHGIELPRERDPADVDAAVEGLGVTPPFLLFVGTLEPRKGIEALLRAHGRVSHQRGDVTLVVVGARGWGKLPSLDRPGVARLGAVSDDDLDALYRRAAALAYPSEYEGFGLPVLEAMVRGCPVVTSDATSLPEVVGDAGITVPLGDLDALAGSLLQMVVDADRRRELAAAGRVRAQQFRWDTSLEAHLAAYRAASGTPADQR